MQSDILLNNLSKDVSIIQEKIQKEFSELSLEQLNWKENNESWSIAECLEHLNIYAKYYLFTIEELIKKAPKSGDNKSIMAKSTWIGKFSINSIHPDNVKKQKTMKHLNPSNSEVKGNVLKRFLDHQVKLQLLLEEATSVKLNKVKIPVEFFKLLKINLGDCFQFLIAHEQRHLNQAMNVKKRIFERVQMNV